VSELVGRLENLAEVDAFHMAGVYDLPIGQRPGYE
jgi:hypothetical protein